jgi:lipid II:glycine glycyltransferase (peptidoglycan interpeptide bridge formation enzyme)
MDYDVCAYTGEDEEAWDAYVDSCPYSTVFHTTGWKKVIENTFGYTPEYYTIKNRNGEIVGVCPAFKVRTLFGKVIISQPFFDYGGPIVDNGYGEALGELLDRFKKYVISREVKYVEFKAINGHYDPAFEKNGFSRTVKALGFYIDVKGKDFEKDIWNRLYTKKSRVRNSVRAAMKNGLRLSEGSDIDTYYDLYLRTVSRLGSPPYPRSLFKNILKYVKPQSRFRFAYLDDQPVAALMSFPKNERHLLVGLVSDPDRMDLHANDLLYNDEIRYATDNHYSIVDFGRTRPDSPYEQFKSKWGATRVDMCSYVFPASMKEDINPYKYYLLFSGITKKVPSILTKTRLGPYLVNKFP